MAYVGGIEAIFEVNKRRRQSFYYQRLRKELGRDTREELSAIPRLRLPGPAGEWCSHDTMTVALPSLKAVPHDAG